MLLSIKFSTSIGDITIEAGSTTSKVVIKGDHTSNTAIHLDANDNNSSKILVEAGILDMKSNTDIKLNADSGNILLEDNSTQYGALTNNSGNLIIKSSSTTAATFTGANVSLAGTVTASSGFVGPLTGTASLATTATAATTATVTDNENTDEENLITFVANAANTTGNHGLEMDGDLTYNPSSGTL